MATNSIGLGANTASLIENSTRFIFPAEPELRNIIPLWMRFQCFEFSSNAISRASAYNQSTGGRGIFTKQKAEILIPAPVNFTSTTANNYTNAPTMALGVLPPLVGKVGDVALDLIPGAKDYFKDVIDAINQGVSEITSVIGAGTGFNSELTQNETTDTMYTPNGASRTYEIRINMPCLTENDSMMAGAIIRAFEALSLPTMLSLFGNVSTTKYFHPPVWVFGVGPIDSMKFDPDWTGNPQLSVLRTVSHKKTAFETNSLAALGQQGLLKPVAYTMTLLFQELEPAFRQTNPGGDVGFNIINRSTGMVTTGTTVLAKVTGD